jgi:hypothetical protein
MAMTASVTSCQAAGDSPVTSTASTTASARGAGEAQIYPAPPIAHPSKSYGVRVLAQPAFVERYAGVSYVRFASRGTVDVEVSIDGAIGSQRIFPAERVARAEVLPAGNVLRLELVSPESFAVWLNDLEPLFVLVDAWEDEPAPSGTVSALDYGADPTGHTLATVPLQAAIDHVADAGGGRVVLPRGIYRTGTLSVKSDVTFYLAPGALLVGSGDPSDYPIDPGRRESGSDPSLPADVRYLGRTMTFSRLLLVDRAANVRITGRGTIDGDGSFVRTQHDAVPNLLRIRQSTNVVVEDVLFRNSAAWTIHPLASSGVTLDNVKIVNDRSNLNTDGIDPDMSSDVTIDHAFIYTKDDGVCVKATGNSDLTGDPQRIKVTNSVVSSLDAALKLGTESSAASFSDVAFEGDHVFDSGRAMSVVVRDGATYDHVTYRGIRVGPHVDHLVEQVVGVRDPDAALGIIHDLVFEDVLAPSFARPADNWTWYAQFRPTHPQPGSGVHVFEGADDVHAVDGLTFKGVVVNGQRLTDEATARDVANLTIGAFVRGVTFE